MSAPDVGSMRNALTPCWAAVIPAAYVGFVPLHETYRYLPDGCAHPSSTFAGSVIEPCRSIVPPAMSRPYHASSGPTAAYRTWRVLARRAVGFGPASA